MLKLKTPEEIARIRNAGRIVATVLDQVGQMVRPGISTLALDAAAEAIIRQAGATPSFKGYGDPPFPASICASIDDEVVHGIPNANRVLREGQIISIDVGAYLEGFHADAARTFPVGTITQAKADLIRVTEESFWAGFAQAVVGNRIGDISAAVQAKAEAHAYGVVQELTGHGVGRHLHEDPDLPNFGHAGRGLRLEAGLVLAMEPMVNQGTRQVAIKEDGWTIVTKDHKPSAHYENTFAITADGPIILTAL
ncbi:MAG: type I methionyl aminopeptidase [Eubacteriales bacterium]|nr:type I methionyl aminopeptidase [Eubacteriales bacterium]